MRCEVEVDVRALEDLLLETTWFWTGKRSEYWWRPFFLETTWFWTEKRSEFRGKPFFWRSLDFGKKTLWICLNPIQDKCKFGSSSFTVASNFKKSSPLSEILATRLVLIVGFVLFLWYYVFACESVLQYIQTLDCKIFENLKYCKLYSSRKFHKITAGLKNFQKKLLDQKIWSSFLKPRYCNCPFNYKSSIEHWTFFFNFLLDLKSVFIFALVNAEV